MALINGLTLTKLIDGLTVPGGTSFSPANIPGLAAWYYASSLVNTPIDPSTLSGLQAHYRADSLLTTKTPDQLSGLVGWYRADKGITLNGSTVSKWADQSGQGNDLNQASAPLQPTYNASDSSYNHQPSLSFASGASQFVQSNLLTGGTINNFTILIIGNDDGTNAYYMEDYLGSTWVVLNGGGVYRLSGGDNLNSTQALSSNPTIFTVIGNGASSQMYFNSWGYNVQGDAGGTPLVNFVIGEAAGNFLNGKLAEVIVFNRVLTQTEIQEVTLYASQRYNISIATPVGEWDDTSGSGDTNKNTKQATAAKKPTLTQSDSSYNNQPTISFASASGQYLASTTWASTLPQPFTIVVMGNDDGTGTTQWYTDCYDGVTETEVFVDTGQYGIAAGTLLLDGANSITPKVFSAVFSGASSKLYVSSSAPAASGAAGSEGIGGGPFVIGAAFNGSNSLNGKIVEIAVFNRALTQAEVTGINAYANSRYGIGTRVSTWNDASGTNDTNKNLIQATIASQPSFIASSSSYNNQSVVSFNGANGMLSGVFNVSIPAISTAFIVGNSGGGSDEVFLDGHDSGNRILIDTIGQKIEGYMSNSMLSGTLPNNVTLPNVYGLVFNGSSSIQYFNAKTSINTGNVGSAVPVGLSVGTSYAGTAYLNGNIAEIIVYSGALNQSQVNQILVYLGNKYGISIAG